MDYEALMRMALTEAELAIPHGDVPVGAVVVADGEIIALRHNERQLTTDPTAHAEVLAMRDACEKLGTWRLDNAELIVTLEPCAMCAGALVNARISRVVIGAPDLEAGALGSVYNFAADPRLRHNFEVVHNILRDECSTALKDFFGELRRARREGSP
ncbi:MAG: tRNA-specific adenosine deaminase [Acidimicrobiaceae bacterium]|nr:tRNA-specific adenosine deaminase [Acidimicrobiaceae bacterium]HAB56535.1 tRNA-specific adenosine deaminase [Acidimicrobiaceae bacterium]